MQPELSQYVLNKLKEKPDENKIEFLTSQIYWSDIHTKFQKYLSNLVPSTHLVADIDDIASILLGTGKLRIVKDNVILNKMKKSNCHDNCAKLFKKGKLKELHTGYALSDDGLWRQHSWGISSNNKIIETTIPRLIYLTSFSWD
jgi:hypothetical protein